MDRGFYKYLPISLTVSGLLVIALIYLTHGYIYHEEKWLFWVLVVSVHVMTCLGFGLLVKKYHYSSITDPLTGLYNRRYFYCVLEKEIERTGRTKTPLSICIIDVDNFKNVNDTYGHLKGDKVLLGVSNILKTQIRKIDIAVRWGGEEFAIILPGTDEEGASAFGERLRAMVEKAKFCCAVTICVGSASITDRMNMEAFILLADRALYKAKETKNNVVAAKA